MDPALSQFLKEHNDFEINDHGKIHCKLTNHDMVAKLSEVEKYVKSDKYIHARDWYVQFSF